MDFVPTVIAPFRLVPQTHKPPRRRTPFNTRCLYSLQLAPLLFKLLIFMCSYVRLVRLALAQPALPLAMKSRTLYPDLLRGKEGHLDQA
jgi:hypothetical protein